MKQPHVFIIIGDCLRAASATGETMPFTSSFADLDFERCYAPSTWTLPSHASLYSQQTPIEHGVSRRGEVFPRSKANLPKLARENGYYTALFSENPTFSEKYGFHHHIDLVDDSINFKPFVSDFSAENYMNEITPQNLRTALRELAIRPQRLRNLANTTYGAVSYLRDESQTEYPHHGKRAFSHIRSFAEKNAEERLFCIANFLDPHDPHYAPPERGAEALELNVSQEERRALWAARDTKEYLLKQNPSVPEDARTHFDSWQMIFDRERDVYHAQIRYFDHLLERWFETLPAEIRRDSLVIVTGDHGQMFGEEGMVHHQTSLHPAGIEVPLFVRVPESWDKNVTDVAETVSWLGLAKALASVGSGDVSGTEEFIETVRTDSSNGDGIVVTADGPTWNTSVLNELGDEYDKERVDELRVRRIGIIEGGMQTVYESKWDEQEITKIEYELVDNSREELSRRTGVRPEQRYRKWLSEPTADDQVDARATARLKQLGYL